MKLLRWCLFAALMVGCAWWSKTAKTPPVTCAEPLIAQLVDQIATCVGAGGSTADCVQELGTPALIQYVSCLLASHVEHRCGGACPFERAAARARK